MGILKNMFKRETIVDTDSLSDPLLQALIGDTSLNRASALEIPVVSSSVDLICNTFAMIPFKLYKEEIIRPVVRSSSMSSTTSNIGVRRTSAERRKCAPLASRRRSSLSA